MPDYDAGIWGFNVGIISLMHVIDNSKSQIIERIVNCFLSLVCKSRGVNLIAWMVIVCHEGSEFSQHLLDCSSSIHSESHTLVQTAAKYSIIKTTFLGRNRKWQQRILGYT